MADAVLSEEVRKRRIADALNGQDDSEDPDPEPDTSDIQSSDADTGTIADVGEKPPPAQEETPAEEAPSAAAEKGPRLGYRFVPVSPPAQDVPQNVPQGTFLGEEGADVSPALTSAPVYSTPIEEGNQQYVIDQATGAKIPRAQLATSQDIAAQPPQPQGAVELPKVAVTAPGEPAPDQLTQVERGELVKPPAEAPGQLTQVERGQLVSVPPGTAPRADLVDPDSDQYYLDEAQRLVALPTPPKAQPALGYKFVPVTPPAQNIPTAPAVKPAEPVTQPVSQQPTKAGQPAQQQQAQQVDTSTFRNPDGSEFPQRVQAVGGKDPAAFIMHHTGGRGTVQGVVDTLHQRGLGVEYVADRDGTIYQIGDSGAQNILPGWGPKGTGLNNSNIVGMEVIAKDNNDVTPAQKDSIARFMAARYPNTRILGHGEVNPGHKEEDEGQATKAAALAYRAKLGVGQVAQEPGAPQAQPVTKQANGLYQSEKPEDFLSGKATTFATPEDIASGADNGVGAPRLGRLDTTQVTGVAIPEEALRAKYGNNYAAWRTARVDVVDPQTGKRLRVPIVDLGPRGDLSAITDMTPTLSNYFGGDKNLMVKLVDNAGPDVTKNPQLFADEQAAIKQGFDSSTLQAGVQKIAPKLGYGFKPVDSARQSDLTQQFTQAQRKSLSDLNEQYGNSPVGLFNRLSKPVTGVSDPMRQEFQANLKAEITKYAQDFYNEPDPAKAFQKATGDANFGTVATEAGRHFMGYLGQADTGINYLGKLGDTNRLTTFAKVLHPDANPEQIQKFIQSITTDIKDPTHRAQTIGTLIASLEPAKQAALDSVAIADSADRVADPQYQSAQNAAIAKKTAWTEQQLKADPRLQGTFAERAADLGGQFGANLLLSFAPPGIRESAFAGQIAAGTRADLKQAHPEWSEAELDRHTEDSTALQLVPQEVLAAAVGGRLGSLVSGIENPAARIGVSALAHTATGAGATTAGQIAANVVAGRPALQGVGEAALAGGLMGLPGGVVAGIAPHAMPERTQVPPVTEERPPVTEERPPVTGEQPSPLSPVTQEDVSRRAYELYEERTSNGQPGTALDDWNRAQAELSRTSEPVLPATMSEAEPINSAIANRYVQERMAAGELGQIDPSQGKSTEDMVQQGLQMSPMQRDGLIDNFMKAKGGDLDQQGAAIRSKEALLSEQARAASRVATADPANPQLQAQAKAAADAVTAFHNGPIKKFKQVWSDSGRALQREIPLDYTTFNGMKEAYLKGNNKEAPPELEPKLQQVAAAVSKTSDAERVALSNLGKEIEKQTRGKPLPTDDQIRARLMEIMKDLPCPT